MEIIRFIIKLNLNVNDFSMAILAQYIYLIIFIIKRRLIALGL